MDIFILVGQRKCRYEGEYAPEVLEAIDQFGNDANPDFLIDAKRRLTLTEEFDALSVVKVRVPSQAITDALFPASKAIPGEVVTFAEDD
jgi:hypothetical protein